MASGAVNQHRKLQVQVFRSRSLRYAYNVPGANVYPTSSLRRQRGIGFAENATPESRDNE